MALSEYIEGVLPGWMRRTRYAHWLGLAGAVALTLDGLIEGVFQARLAALPGQIDDVDFGGFTSVDALPLIGRDRGIVRGFTESIVSYARRLRRWRRSWRAAGTARELLEQLAAVLGPNPPRLRIVSPGGVWYTREADGVFRVQNTTGTGFAIALDGTVTADANVAHGWDWDSTTIPANLGKGDAGRIWLFVYLPCNPPYFAADEGAWGDWGSNYGDDDKVEGVDSTAPHIELLRGVGLVWRAAGIKLSHIILAFDPASFDPLNLAPAAGSMPDGNWGQHGKVVGGVLVPSRLGTARYVRGTAGVLY